MDGTPHVCNITRLIDGIEARREHVKRNLPELNFDCPPQQTSFLKGRITQAFTGIDEHEAGEILRDCDISPKPSNVTVAPSGNGYALIFVVGPTYKTIPVVIEA